MSFDAASFEKTVRRAMDLFDTPAVSVAIVQGEDIIYESGFGTRTQGKTEPVDAHTEYAIASMSKSMTAASLAMMVEQGKLRWDDRVRDILPDFRLYDEFTTREMRVKDLMIHDSGLRSEGAGILWYGSDYSRDEVIRRLRYIRPVTGFRSTYAYQNVCYLIGGAVLEAVSGISWDDFLSRNLFAPLEMNRTFPTLKASAGLDNVATPHAPVRGIQQTIPYRNHDNCGPAASVMSNAHNLADYLSMLLNRGSFHGKQILAPESVRTLHTPYVFDPEEMGKTLHQRMDPRFPGYGFGWHIQEYAGRRLIYHSGGVDGMRCRMNLFPEDNFAIVILTNCENRNTYNALLNTGFDLMLGLDPIDWVKLFAERTPEAEEMIPSQIPGTAPQFDAEALCGIYRDSAYGDISVNMEEKTPTLRFTHSPAFTADLSHYHYDTWKLNWRDAYIPEGLVTFEPGNDGKIRSIRFDQPSLLDVHFDELDEHILRIGGICH